MRPIRKTRNALFLMGAGAAAAYFFDPDSGPERREKAMSQFRAMSGDSSGSQGGTISSAGQPDLSSSSPEAANAFSGRMEESPGAMLAEDGGPTDVATGQPLGGAPFTDRNESMPHS
jgi:hypothetical protein